MRKTITLLILFFSIIGVEAQDMHFSNYQPALAFLNPGATAGGNSDMRVGVQYRNQWATIPAAYTTMGAMAELKHKNLGFGLNINQNKAGEASLKTTGVMLTGAYHKRLAREGALSLGVGLGRLQKSVNPSLLTFDNQYVEGLGYDAGLSSNENFLKTTAALTDVAVGLVWQGQWGHSNNVRSTGGLSFSHLHLPNESFFGAMEVLPMKTVLHGKVDLKMDNQIVFSPHALVQKQGVHQELLAGIMVNGTFQEKSDFNVGMAYRWGDAVILQVGMEMGDKGIWVSYDSNISTLKSATTGKGAWELGLYLTFNKNEKKQLVDTDGDGIYDNRDRCIKIPGLPELQGCPDLQVIENEVLDSDGDGVNDDLDRCPLEPGLPCFYGCNDRDRDGTLDWDDACPEIFGHPENQGCPVKDRDADRDGVPDSEDYCVFLKGSPDFHGCPDSDKDGISDIDDECPYIKGVKEKNGCPKDASIQQQIASVIIEFETDQAIISPLFQQLLSEFAIQVDQLPNAHFMIAGHTDAEGDRAYNYELGLRRAAAVKNYLIRQGIPYSQLKTISYGEGIPRRENSTVDGKARNRRVEVMVIGSY